MEPSTASWMLPSLRYRTRPLCTYWLENVRATCLETATQMPAPLVQVKVASSKFVLLAKSSKLSVPLTDEAVQKYENPTAALM